MTSNTRPVFANTGVMEHRKAELNPAANWVRRFIREYRDGVKLTGVERANLLGAYNYLPPSQVDVFSISEPRCDIVVNSQFRHRKDLDVRVHGPMALSQISRYVDRLAYSHEWAVPLTRPERRQEIPVDQTLGTRLIHVFARHVSEIQDWAVTGIPRPSLPRALDGQAVTRRSFSRLVPGGVEQIDSAAFASRILAAVKRRAARRTAGRGYPVPREPGSIAYTTSLFPSVILGPIRRPLRLSDAVSGKLKDRLQSDVKELRFARGKVLIDRLGNVTVQCGGSEEARKILNTIIASVALVGIPSSVARDIEIGESRIDTVSGAVLDTLFNAEHGRFEPADYRFAARFMDRAEAIQVLRRPVIDRTLVVKCVKLAESIYKKHLSDEVILLLESSTQLSTHAYALSFSTSWILIEREIANSFLRALKAKRLDQKRVQKLMTPSYWSTDSVIEALNLLGEISPPHYRTIMELKRVRNAYAHKGAAISRQQATDCFAFARAKVVDQLQRHHV